MVIARISVSSWKIWLFNVLEMHVFRCALVLSSICRSWVSFDSFVLISLTAFTLLMTRTRESRLMSKIVLKEHD